MKNKKTLIIVIILCIVFLLIGGTFAYFTWATNASQETTVTFTVGKNFSCSAHGGGNITSNSVQLAPAPCNDFENAIRREIWLDVPNNSGANLYLDMYLKVNSISENLAATQNFKWALTSVDYSCLSNVVASGTFYGATANTRYNLLDNLEFSTRSWRYKYYYLWIWLDEEETDPATMNQEFDMTLEGSCSNHASQTIIDTISDNAVIDNTRSTYVNSNTGINWNNISSDTNGKGLYIRSGTENDTYPVYYYRGAVTDNNVLFGGFCWKIVRTTSTGGTKLIYNGIPSNGTCNNTGTDSQLASTSAFNSNYTSPADVGYMVGTRYTIQNQTMTGITDTYMYGTGYDETNHRLVSTDAVNFAGTDWATYYNQLNNNHYTCFNTSGECNQVYYIYYTDTTTAYYVQIPSGKTISGMLDEMLTSSSNTTNSTIKTAIDNWYAANMTSYTSYLEDTPYCSERTIYQLNGWSPTGSTASYMYFGAYGRMHSSPYTPSLTCNTNDAFTMSSSIGNGKLTYPVGLLTADEIRLSGAKAGTATTTYYLYNGQYWWSASPYYWGSTDARGFSVYDNGTLHYANVSYARGVRPVVSLKAGIKFSNGTGTVTDPYVVQ